MPADVPGMAFHGVVSMINPAHPGEILREEIEALGWTVSKAAAEVGMTRQVFSRILNGHGGVSARLAIDLEGKGIGNAQVWMRMQAAYELARERRQRDGAAAAPRPTAPAARTSP